MTPPTVRLSIPSSFAPALIGGLAAAVLGSVAFSPLGPALVSAFNEGWLAIFLDAQLFRVLCF